MGYFIGLDMGTSSVGWAVTGENYELLRKKGRDMWGVRLFDEADTAAGRRTMRVAKRRRRREVARIGYLKELFNEEINKVDPGFFQRLEDSKFFKEDKKVQQPFALFADNGYTDKDYYEEYPTIFHLRKELIMSKEPKDVRLVYLAILNIFKHRGHFLNNNLDGEGIGALSACYTPLCRRIEEVLEIQFPCKEEDMNTISEVLASSQYSKSRKVEKLVETFEIQKSKEKPKVELLKLICGLKGTLPTIFTNVTWDEDNKKFSISFSDGDFDEKIIKAEEILDAEAYELLLDAKQVHDWGVLANIMKGDKEQYEYLSFARVASYEKHGKDLKCLKELYHSYAPDKYDEMFRIMADNNYSAYVGSVNSDKEPQRRGAKVKTEDFMSAIKKQVSGFPDSEEKDYVLAEIEKGTFLPKQLTASNGVIPNQIHKMELKKILENAESYLPFLLGKGDKGLTASERILQLFSFQIPYYVGPLSAIVDGENIYSKNMWSVRKEKGQVFPWNFEEKIDTKASAENFISRMVNHCTYISGEQVLPKNSLLYEKFVVLNELNNLKINGEKPDVALKQRIFEDLL